jgi:hypothetical protein
MTSRTVSIEADSMSSIIYMHGTSEGVCYAPLRLVLRSPLLHFLHEYRIIAYSVNQFGMSVVCPNSADS